VISRINTSASTPITRRSLNFLGMNDVKVMLDSDC